MDRAPILEYLSQSNDNADLVSVDDRFKFVDDLSVLEIVDLLTVGLTSYNLKLNVHNQYIPANNLKSQTWLEGINQWTFNQKMLINENEVLGLLKMILRISTGSFRINDNLYTLITKGCGALRKAQTGGKISLVPEHFENIHNIEQYWI
jgi:hypothetical protein